MSYLIELKGVTKRYGEVVALNNASLKVMKGEILTIIGPNGSGKTTLLRIMAGIDRPTSGEFYFDGVKVDGGNMSEIRLRGTMVFQRTALFNATVYKNLAYGLKLRGYPKNEIKEKVKEVLRLVRLEGYENRSTKKLSGGEQQRVSLARALVLETELLLLDEPTANLDPKNVSIIEETISQVNKERHATIVMATHNIFQAETLANRLAILLEGKIVEVGTAKGVFNFQSKYLASFARLENVFLGTSRITEDGTSLVEIGDGIEIEAAVEKTGKATIYMRPEDITLSKIHTASSARNTFKGRIVGISDLGSVMRLRIDAGKEFIAQITKKSFVEMQLNIDIEVFFTFKASSVHMI
ncbi:MAG: ABC transporter ATP-binding protein [archaeon]|nr:ABC transporter ATP-binding protein [archaeon]MCP8306775.1 ABC transporter ATP-binding protein [archaeon]